MANDEHHAILKQGTDGWNVWRSANPEVVPHLRRADLRGADLSGAIFWGANLRYANLSGAHLRGADLRASNLGGAALGYANLDQAKLSNACLSNADFSRANLAHADLSGVNRSDADLSLAVSSDFRGPTLRDANLCDANLHDADLCFSDLHSADLIGADFSEARLGETVLANVDLSATRGLASCRHVMPSIIDHRTLQRSGQLPLSFLRGCGLPNSLIDYLPSLLNQAIQFHSCFISYSSRDDDFARRLYADLQNEGIRCWFAPEDMKIGERIRTRIDEVIRLHEKLLLVLSANSIDSDWVEKEVETAFEKERETKGTVLFPVRLDAAVMTSRSGWAADIRRTRHIGDFSSWKDHNAYQKGLKRLLRDLIVDQPPLT